MFVFFGVGWHVCDIRVDGFTRGNGDKGQRLVFAGSQRRGAAPAPDWRRPFRVTMPLVCHTSTFWLPVRFAPRGRGEIYQRYVSGVFVTLNGSLTCRCRCFDPLFAASLPDSSEQLLTRPAGLHHFELTCLHFTLFFSPWTQLSTFSLLCFSVIHCLNTHINLLQQRAQLSHELICSTWSFFQIYSDVYCALACRSSLFSLQISSR